ncbi:MAG TPA: hypothetical protein VFE52_01130 [Devosia sp.]|jgi:hypothetical protein|nr:hypothetical protein [Devosia sp.]
MNIRSLLLGSVAAAGLATTGYAADLGVVTSLDVCDELGLSGLTISSDENCLVITGGVTFEYKVGDYDPGVVYTTFARTGNTYEVDDNDFMFDSSADVDAWLKFVATSNSDFGPATATIKLISEDNDGTADWTVGVDEAWVGIGDTTMLMAGYKGSIFNAGDDAPLNYLGLFNSSDVDVGVGFSDENERGGAVIQLVHNLGNGLTIKGAVEDLGSAGPALLTGVGVLEYAGEGVSAHVSGSVDDWGLYNVHAGFKGTWDPITVVGAIAANNGWWNALGSASATFDMFTLAVAGEATSAGEWGVGGSIGATVTDGVTLNLGSRYFDGVDDVWQAELGVSAAATETITVTAAIGAIDGDADPLVMYGKAGLAWAPGGGFTSSIEGRAQSNGAFSTTFKAAKSIQ